MASVSDIERELKIQSWTQMVEECKASGVPRNIWCKVNGIPESTYGYRIRKLKQHAVQSSDICQGNQTFALLEKPKEFATSDNRGADSMTKIALANAAVEFHAPASTEIIRTILEVLLHAK